MNPRRARFDPWLAVAALLALIPAQAILKPGMPQTADGIVHLLRVAQVERLWQAGVLYPRWAPDFYLGYGYPFFNFYAPGAHLVAALLAGAGLGTARGVTALQALALALYPTGAYLFARALLAPYGGRQSALISAALYLYAPLRFRELFFQGNLSQFVALAWLPWCAWLLTEASLRRSRRWAVAAAVAIGALVYLHAPSAFVALPFLAAYALLLAVCAGDAWRRLVIAAAAMLVGLALSAPFWLPAMHEFRYVNINAISTGMFNARLNLVPLDELLAAQHALDEASINPPFPRALGPAQALLALAGLAVAFYWVVRGDGETPPTGQPPARGRIRQASHSDGFPGGRRALGTLLLGVGGLLMASLALILPAAGPLWDHLPLARIIAFPWRLLGPALLWAALLGGVSLAPIPARFRTAGLIVALVIISLSAATYLFPRPFVPVHDVGLAGLARYELAGGARATASANEYLPSWVTDPDPPGTLADALAAGEHPDRLDRQALPDGARAEVIETGPPAYAYRLALPRSARVRFRQFYFPGWRAWLDGVPAEIVPDSQHGLIELDVPAGEHTLRLAFGNTPTRTVGWLLALGGALAVVAAMWPRRRSDEAPAQPDGRAATGWRPALTVAAIILALAAIKVLIVEPHTRWFRLNSSAEAPAGMQFPVHARFANGVELLGYDLPRATVEQAGDLPVRLYWRAQQPQASASRPFLHLDAISGERTWANQTKDNPGDKPTTSWPADFYVVDDYRLTVESDAPPVIASLRAGLLDADGQLVPLLSGSDVATLGRVRITERDPLSVSELPGAGQTYRLGPDVELVGHSATIEGDAQALVVKLYWRTARPLTEDYTVFLHVNDAAGQTIAQGDGPPAAGLYPSSGWLSGQIIADERRLPLPAGADLSGLQITTGLYRLEDGTRLRVMDARGGEMKDNQIPLSLSR